MESNDNDDVLGAFNALLGYIGGQASTETVFERLLWPQRHFSVPISLPLPHHHGHGYGPPALGALSKLIVLHSMAGPLSQSALAAMDSLWRSGVLAGPERGHMLGTPFFGDTKLASKMQAAQHGEPPERESQVRNCVWVRALLNVPVPDVLREDGRLDTGMSLATVAAAAEEEGRSEEKKRPVRARVMVAHLTLTKATSDDMANRSLPFVSEHTGQVHLQALLGILLSELMGVGVAIGVAAILRSFWAFLFVAPLILRLLGAFAAVHREPLDQPPDSVNSQPHRDWEIACPALESRFLLISGPPGVVQQFFRHYGHPRRNRPREIVQVALIIALGVYFPLALLCSSLWMNKALQYVWTVWEVVLVIAMHCDRYTLRGSWSTTTETRLAELFAWRPGVEGDRRCWNTALLFGCRRRGDGVVMARLRTRVVDSYGEGKKEMEVLIRERQQ